MAQKILSARRSYEFAPDDIRLTVLSNSALVEHVRQAFHFDVSEIDQPPATFGPVPTTAPPGLVFAFGVADVANGTPTPIRFIHFEQRRVVVDIAGPSGAIEPIFQEIREMLGQLKAPDGAPALGQPTHALDYSEIVTKLSTAPSAMLAPEVCRLFVDAAGEARSGMLAVPSWEIRVQPADAEYGSTTVPTYETFRLELRGGTKPSDRIFYSGAPLDTETHAALLRKLEIVFGASQPARQRRAKAR